MFAENSPEYQKKLLDAGVFLNFVDMIKSSAPLSQEAAASALRICLAPSVAIREQLVK